MELLEKKYISSIVGKVWKQKNNVCNTVFCILHPLNLIKSIFVKKNIRGFLPHYIGRQLIGIGNTCKVYKSTNKEKVIKLCSESNVYIFKVEFSQIKKIFEKYNSNINIPSTQVRMFGNNTIIRQKYIDSHEKLSIKNSALFQNELQALLKIVRDLDKQGKGLDLFGQKGYNYSNPTISLLKGYPILENIIVHNGKLYFIDIEKVPNGYEEEYNEINEGIIIEMLKNKNYSHE